MTLKTATENDWILASWLRKCEKRDSKLIKHVFYYRTITVTTLCKIYFISLSQVLGMLECYH